MEGMGGPSRGRNAPRMSAAQRQEVLDMICHGIVTCGRIMVELPPDYEWSVRDQWFDVQGSVTMTGVTDWTNVVAHKTLITGRGFLRGFGQDIDDLAGFEASQIEWRLRVNDAVVPTYGNFVYRLGGICEGNERPTRVHVPPGMTVALQARNVSVNTYVVSGSLVGYDARTDPKVLDPTRGSSFHTGI